MRLPSSLLLLCIILALPAARAAAAPNQFSVVTPPDRSLVEGGLISVVLTPPEESLNAVRISVNERERSFRKSTVGKSICLEEVRLDMGMNRLRITLLKGKQIIGEKELAVFFRSDLSPKAVSAPAGFKRFVFHVPEHERHCAPCHPMRFSREDENPPSPQQSRCFTCHRKITAGRFGHAPATEWSCITCHRVRSHQGGGSTLEADSGSCANCHDDAMAKWSKKDFRHGPSDAGHCIACHNPHSSDQPGFLHVNATDICVSCHEEFLSKPHVIGAVSSKGGHPVRISPDPFRHDRDFTCASCHNPHAGDSPNFLNDYKTSMSIHHFCLSCHRL